MGLRRPELALTSVVRRTRGPGGVPGTAPASSLPPDPSALLGSALKAWLKRGAGLTGDPVSAWADASGAGLVTGTAASQGTANLRPALSTLDGYACPLFAADSYLDAAFGSTLAQTLTVFLTFALTDVVSTLALFDGTSGASDRVGAFTNADGATRLNAYAGSFVADTTFAPDTATRVVALEFGSGGAVKFYENGLYVNTASGQGSNAMGGARIGAEATSAAFKLKGRVREFGVVNRALTLAEHASLALWLRQGTAVANYSVVTGTDAGTSQAYTVLVPNGTITGLVLYSHGYGETETAIRADYLKGRIVKTLLDNGYIVAGTNQGGEALWGNTTNQTALTSLRTLLAGTYTLPKTVVLAQSAGGIAGLNVLLGNSFVSGWYGIYPACSLDWAKNTSGNATFIADINTAYPSGFTGFDPCARLASAYAGKRLRCTASASDTVVSKTGNADALNTLCSGTATEMNVVAASGDHGNPSHFVASDVLSFVGRC